MNGLGDSVCPLCRHAYRTLNRPSGVLQSIIALLDPPAAIERHEEVRALEEFKDERSPVLDLHQIIFDDPIHTTTSSMNGRKRRLLPRHARDGTDDHNAGPDPDHDERGTPIDPNRDTDDERNHDNKHLSMAALFRPSDAGDEGALLSRLWTLTVPTRLRLASRLVRCAASGCTRRRGEVPLVALPCGHLVCSTTTSNRRCPVCGEAVPEPPARSPIWAALQDLVVACHGEDWWLETEPKGVMSPLSSSRRIEGELAALACATCNVMCPTECRCVVQVSSRPGEHNDENEDEDEVLSDGSSRARRRGRRQRRGGSGSGLRLELGSGSGSESGSGSGTPAQGPAAIPASLDEARQLLAQYMNMEDTGLVEVEVAEGNEREGPPNGGGSASKAASARHATRTQKALEERMSLCPYSRKPFVHFFVGCDLCGIYPIIGPRWVCHQCVAEHRMGFDLCHTCYYK